MVALYQELKNHKKKILLQELKMMMISKKELKSKFILKADFQKSIEQAAIKEASKDPDIDEHWEDIMLYYIPRQGKDSVEDILTDLQRAKKAWRVDNPAKVEEKTEDTDKKSKSWIIFRRFYQKGKEKKACRKEKNYFAW